MATSQQNQTMADALGPDYLGEHLSPFGDPGKGARRGSKTGPEGGARSKVAAVSNKEDPGARSKVTGAGGKAHKCGASPPVKMKGYR